MKIVRRSSHAYLFTTHRLGALVISTIAFLSVACSSLGNNKSETEGASNATNAESTVTDNKDGAPAITKAQDDSAATGTTDSSAQNKPVQPLHVVESCKDQPYIQYELQARQSLEKGLQATKDGKFGVGFRNLDEHKRWSETHNTLFQRVSAACETLSNCAKSHGKDKDSACAAEAKQFDDWQSLAKTFREKAQSVETTQPPLLCSLKADPDDPSSCFEDLAVNIDRACQSENCKDASLCWRAISFLDNAISQAEQSCRFAHEKLSECRAYTESTQQRKQKFSQCEEMQGRLKLQILPVI